MKNSNNAKKANAKMRFFIPAQQRAVDPSELCFQLNVAARTAGDADLPAVDQSRLRLAEGGVHSLFGEMIIRDGGGNVIEKIDNCDLIAEILQDTLSTKEVKNNLLNVEGVCDDQGLFNTVHGKFNVNGNTLELKAPVAQVVANALPAGQADCNAAANAAAVVAVTTPASPSRALGVGTQFLTQLRPGSVVKFDGNGHTVACVVSDAEFASATDIAADVAAANIVVGRDFVEGLLETESRCKKFHHDGLFTPDGAVHCFQPCCSGFSSQNKCLHLDHHGGLEFEFTLDSNAVIFDDTDTNNNANIFIKKGHVHCTALEFSPVVEAALAKAHMRGLSVSFPVHHVVSRTQNPSTSVSQEHQESLAILKMVKIVGRPTGFDTNTGASFFFEDPTSAKRIHWEINKQRFTECGNDDISPQVVFMNDRIGKNLLGDCKHATISHGEFKEAGKSASIFNTQNCKEGNHTGVNTNRATMRLKIEGGDGVGSSQPGIVNQGRQIDVSMMHEQHIVLKDGDSLTVRSQTFVILKFHQNLHHKNSLLMQINVKQHKIHFNSKDRIAGTTNNSNCQLNSAIDDASSVSIARVRFPITCCNVSAKNDILEIENSSGNKTSMELTKQNCGATELVTELQTELSTNASSVGTFTPTRNAETGKFSMGCSDNFKMTKNECSKFLGHDDTAPLSALHVADDMSDLSPKPVHVQTDLQLDAELAGQSSNMVCEVGGDVSFGSILHDNEKPSERIESMKKKNASNLKFALVDGDGDEIENNGVDCSMTVSLFHETNE
eukprot:jgi/Bigna1/131131/aug1.13_g5839